MLEDTDKLAFGKVEAARLLGIPPAHITLAVRNSELNVHQIGARSLIARDDLLAWFKLHPSPHDRRRKVQPHD